MKGAIDIFRFLLDAIDRDEKAALVTITDVIGTSSRGTGTHLAVTEAGNFFGSVSGGCIDAAVVAEAVQAISDGDAKRLRLGAGSPYMDIRLPCGGGLELWITPHLSRELLAQCLERLESRLSLSLEIQPTGRIRMAPAASHLLGGSPDSDFIAHHDPDLRLVIVGHGSETTALAELATTYGAVVEVVTPDHAVAEATRQIGARVAHLDSRNRSALLSGDPHTAVVLLFHDHDWEDELLVQALRLPSFFIGAMGSRQTHERRLAMLRRRGIADEVSARIVGPIGLLPSTRDPKTLALSILSQIVDAHAGSKHLSSPQGLPRNQQRRNGTRAETGSARSDRSIGPSAVAPHAAFAKSLPFDPSPT